METKKSNKFGLKMKSVRAGLGLTQRDMAKLVGISTASLSYYETGFRIPPVDIYTKIIEMAQE